MKIDKKLVKRTYSVRFDTYTLEKILKIAKKQKKTVSDIVRTAIKKLV